MSVRPRSSPPRCGRCVPAGWLLCSRGGSIVGAQGLTPDHTKAWNFIQFFREAHPQSVSFPQYFKAAGYLAL